MSERKLHIVHTESSCGWGGQEIRILSEARGMLARGHQVTLVTPPEARIAAVAREMGLPLLTLPIARKRLPGLLALWRCLATAGAGIDVLNTHSSTDSWLTAAACSLLRNAPPIVRTRHVSSPVGDRVSTRWLYQSAAAHVVVTGEALRHQLHRDNGFALASMTSVPTGIDLSRFVRLDPMARAGHASALGMPDAPYVGILATLRNWKGHAYLFDAFAQLADEFEAWQLLVVGDGPQRNNLVRRAQELGLSHRIHFVGNRDDPERWLQLMDLFVLPSYGDEGVPQSIMQAMACGLPVISTPVGAIAEAVDADRTGLLVAPKSVSELVVALRRLMADDSLRAAFASAGWEKAQRQFGVDIMLDRMEAIFRTHARHG